MDANDASFSSSGVTKGNAMAKDASSGLLSADVSEFPSPHVDITTRAGLYFKDSRFADFRYDLTSWACGKAAKAHGTRTKVKSLTKFDSSSSS